MEKIQEKFSNGAILETPSRKKEFIIDKINEQGVSLLVGQMETLMFISSSCLNGIPSFLRNKGWIRIGAIHGSAFTGSLDNYVQHFTHGTSAASYVVPILEQIHLIKVDRSRPAKIKLRV